MGNPIYYLAAPYSHPTLSVREHRARAATIAAARLTDAGMTVISPLTMAHEITRYGITIPHYDYAHNKDLCERLMDAADVMVVLDTPDTAQSVGVKEEITYMESKGKKIMYLRCSSLGQWTLSGELERVK